MQLWLGIVSYTALLVGCFIIAGIAVVCYLSKAVLFEVLLLMLEIVGGFIATYIALYLSDLVFRCLFISDGRINRNQKVYAAFDYFANFVYVVAGFPMTLQRMKSALVSLVFYYPRLDVPLKSRGNFASDFAYASYVAVLLLDHQHNNPVLVTFIELLLQGTPCRHNSYANDETSRLLLPLLPEPPVKATKARIRWHLARMLIANPSLQSYRKKTLQAR